MVDFLFIYLTVYLEVFSSFQKSHKNKNDRKETYVPSLRFTSLSPPNPCIYMGM